MAFDKIDPDILKNYTSPKTPSFNYNADYQTNAPSYFDYLGNLNKIFTVIINSINKQIDYTNAIANKDIKVEDTDTIKLIMEGNFKVDNQILLKGRLKLSNFSETRTYKNRTFDITNAFIQKEDGLYIRDYTEVIAYLSSLIEENEKIIKNLTREQNRLSTIQDTQADTIERLEDFRTSEFTKAMQSIISYQNKNTALVDSIQKRVADLEGQVG